MRTAGRKQLCGRVCCRNCTFLTDLSIIGVSLSATPNSTRAMFVLVLGDTSGYLAGQDTFIQEYVPTTLLLLVLRQG